MAHAHCGLVADAGKEGEACQGSEPARFRGASITFHIVGDFALEADLIEFLEVQGARFQVVAVDHKIFSTPGGNVGGGQVAGGEAQVLRGKGFPQAGEALEDAARVGEEVHLFAPLLLPQTESGRRGELELVSVERFAGAAQVGEGGMRDPGVVAARVGWPHESSDLKIGVGDANGREFRVGQEVLDERAEDCCVEHGEAQPVNLSG